MRVLNHLSKKQCAEAKRGNVAHGQKKFQNIYKLRLITNTKIVLNGMQRQEKYFTDKSTM